MNNEKSLDGPLRHQALAPEADRMLQKSSPNLESVSRISWPPGSWEDGPRKSAFQPYRPTTVLTNLQRGNIPTETPVPEEVDISFHHRAGQGELTELDIEQESDVDLLDDSGLSALMWASSYGQVPTVQLLLQHGAQLELEGPQGETPLLLASASGHHDLVRLLLSEGASVNHIDEMGNTALMYAAYGNHPHCTNELLLRGADLTMVNFNGDTAYGITISKGSSLDFSNEGILAFGWGNKISHLADIGNPRLSPGSCEVETDLKVWSLFQMMLAVKTSVTVLKRTVKYLLWLLCVHCL